MTEKETKSRPRMMKKYKRNKKKKKSTTTRLAVVDEEKEEDIGKSTITHVMLQHRLRRLILQSFPGKRKKRFFSTLSQN